MSTRRTILLLLCTALFVGACSSTTFVYNRLDFILPWYVDDYARLNARQEAYLDELLAPFLDWHRTRELPQYVATLNNIEHTLDKRLAPDDVAALWAEFEAAWFRLEAESLEWLLDLGGQLSDEQLEGFVVLLWQRQGEYEEEYLERDDEEFHEDSYDSLQDSANEFLGRLSREQRELLQKGSLQLWRSDEVWLRERAAWLQQLAALLQREDGWQQRIRDAVARRNDTLSAEYVKTYEHNLGVLYGVIADLLNSRSAKQDRHLRDRLSRLRGELETLVAQGREPMRQEAASVQQ